jgi:hypothetical protein
MALTTLSAALALLQAVLNDAEPWHVAAAVVIAVCFAVTAVCLVLISRKG